MKIKQNDNYSNLSRLSISFSFLSIIFSAFAFLFDNTYYFKSDTSDFFVQFIYMLVLLTPLIAIKIFDNTQNNRFQDSKDCYLKIKVIEKIMNDIKNKTPNHV